MTSEKPPGYNYLISRDKYFISEDKFHGLIITLFGYPRKGV
ncbi:hypothetical protein KNP414_04284 [Paenibacillus mucilaginosus KNP414]|uniref:Uncharacterized protein n=1 Tax=Paenibacillus mucilaginosus (strain KNP414) TaxID=1036673 RepID=F8FHV9_PAEMK|nr:hypothetical protein KNP414_04284 [Paenibacillus mucilaginosus KNP414]